MNDQGPLLVNRKGEPCDTGTRTIWRKRKVQYRIFAQNDGQKSGIPSPTIFVRLSFVMTLLCHVVNISFTPPFLSLCFKFFKSRSVGGGAD